MSGLSYSFESLGAKRTGADIIVDEESGNIVVSENGERRTFVLKVLDSKRFQHFQDILDHLLNGVVGRDVSVSLKAEQAIREQARQNCKLHGGAIAASLREQSIPFRT